ncbi:nucleolar protein 9 [Trichosurus vulpecula]|uniref:nucleolar protein 9 n=1 Tax=Trichosurus vulpecula TaxID=9337 RepID=UPI00186ADFF4|nr:nucleolar protein 9 [Trichosurus vulpecula]
MGVRPHLPQRAGHRRPGRGVRGRARSEQGPHPHPRPAPNPHPRPAPESLTYFRRALEALKETPESGEERELLIHNVLKELETQAVALATDRAGSAMLQELLSCSPPAPLCTLLAALLPHLSSVACHRSGAHVLQSIMLQLPRFPEALTKKEEGVVKDGDLESLEELVLKLASEVRDALVLYSGDTHGSFVVRTLLQVLGGTILESEVARPRGPQSLDGQRAPVREWKPASFEVPDTFLSCLQELSSCFLKDISVFITDKVSSFCLQVALQVLHRKLPKACGCLCDSVITYLSTRNSAADSSPLLLFLRDQTSSRLLERVLLASEPPQLQSLFEDHFQGQLQSLAAHPIANFPLQRLLDAITTPQLLSQVFEELSPALEAVLAQGHPGVVIALVGACRRVGTHQAQILQLLLEAFHCAEPPSRQVACVPLFGSLTAYEVYYGLEEEDVPSEHKLEVAAAWPLGEVTVPGSLLLQHLLHFSILGPVLPSLTSMEGPQLLALAQSPAGSHVLDAVLTSSTVTGKQRRRILRRLKGHYVALACSRHGSRVLDAIWNEATLGTRKEIAAELGEQNQKLMRDPFGHHVARNVALGTFLKRRGDWEQQQGAVAKRRKALSTVLGD